MTNGWMDQRGISLINFIVNYPKGTFYLNSVETSSEEKAIDCLMGLIKEHMKLVGVENDEQVCTDNAASYVLAGKKLMNKYPSVFWTPSAAHCLDPVLEDIGKIKNFKRVISTGRKITSFIYSHTCLHDFVLKSSNNKELVRCGGARFATSFLTLQNLYEMKAIFKGIFVSKF